MPPHAHRPERAAGGATVTELTGIGLYFAWVFAVALSMPTWPQAVAWIFMSHGVAGILHVQIVLSHWSMHSYAGRAYTGADDEWYITTMRTTMNVATPPLLDAMLRSPPTSCSPPPWGHSPCARRGGRRR